jgi:hypothetical protein
VKTSQEITQEIRRIRERVKSLSGFWISEFAAAISTLEWAVGKRDKSPSEDIGSAESGQGEVAKRLLEAVAKEARVPAKPKEKPKEKAKEARVPVKEKKAAGPKRIPKKGGAGGGSRTHTPVKGGGF